MALSFEAARRALRHLGQLALLRADLAAEELALARRQWVGWFAMALSALALMVVALVAAGAWLTLVLWDRLGALTPGILALLFGLATALLLRTLMQGAGAAASPLAQTRAALREDYESLASALVPERTSGDEEASR
jgi:ABC-type multidrug transport system fused ATPase/permease subunit